MSETKAVRFSGWSDDLLCLDIGDGTEWSDFEIGTRQVGNYCGSPLDAQEMDEIRSNGWRIEYPNGEGFYVAGRYGDNGLWTFTVVASGSHKEGETPEMRFPLSVNATHEITGKGYSMALTVSLPAGSKIDGWPS